MFERIILARGEKTRQVAIRRGLDVVTLLEKLKLADAATGKAVIFTLHHVRPDPGHCFSPNAHLSITPEFLDAAIREAKKLGYEAVHLEDLPEAMTGSLEHRRLMAFTLDDGNRDNLVHAAPVFRSHGVPYTVFVTKGFVDRSRSMWWETAEELLRAVDEFRFDFGAGAQIVTCHANSEKRRAFKALSAFVDSREEDEAVRAIDAAARAHAIDPKAIVDREIMNADELRMLLRDPLARLGGHTVTHCNMARVSSDRLRREIVNCLDAIESWTGRRPRSFAYPYGFSRACGPREAAALAECGVPIAVTTQPGLLQDVHLSNLGLLPRVSLNGLFQKPRYVRALMTGLPFRFAQ